MGRRKAAKAPPPPANSAEQPLFILSSEEDDVIRKAGSGSEEKKDGSVAENSSLGAATANAVDLSSLPDGFEEHDGVVFESGGDKIGKKGKKRSRKVKKQKKRDCEVELEKLDDESLERAAATEIKMNFVDDDDEENEKKEVEAAAEAVQPVETLVNEDGDGIPSPKADNLVLRKLLRGPRYFDPPDNSWGNCYHCGGEGHRTADCTAEKRKKPCYYCGSTEHSFKKCTKGHDCYKCKKGGHKAKDCPEKSTSVKDGLMDSKICLRCGDNGHDMFSCKNDYFPEDLEAIRCYVCGSSGHLCCYDSTEHVSKEVSCYKCGHPGHIGMACARLQGESDNKTPTKCYNCGEGGHFARECSHSLKACSKSRGENNGASASSTCRHCGKTGHFIRDCPSPTKNACHKCGENGHFVRDCPTYLKSGKRSRNSEKSRKSKKIKYDDNGYSEPMRRGGWTKEDPRESPSPRKKSNSSRKRGGWIPENKMEPSSPYRKANMDDRWSPVTPTDRRHQSNSHGQTSGSYRNDYMPQSRSMHSQSSNQSLQRFPASRFYNYSNNGSSGRSNDWW